jgi:ATP-dependent exoDNAse (exonuclease V) beta subunit
MRRHWKADPWAWRAEHHFHVLPRLRAPDAAPDEIRRDTMIGTLLHRIFECHGLMVNFSAGERHRRIDAMVRSLVDELAGSSDEMRSPDSVSQGRLGEWVTATEAILDRVSERDSGVRRLLEAPGAVEVNFALRLDRWHISGRFDKVLETLTGPELVDWKTADGPDPCRLVEEYRPQVQLYALALTRLSRADIPPEEVRVHLALLAHNRVETLAFGRAELESFEEQLKGDLRHMESYGLAVGMTFAP